MAGFVRHCSSTDIQTSRIQVVSRSVPWDQMVKRGVEEEYARCVAAWESTSGLPSRPVVDGYQSVVCEQLRSLGPESSVFQRSPGNSRRPCRGTVQRPKSPGRDADQVSSNLGQGTGGRPGRNKKPILARIEGSPEIDAPVREFTIEESSTE